MNFFILTALVALSAQSVMADEALNLVKGLHVCADQVKAAQERGYEVKSAVAYNENMNQIEMWVDYKTKDSNETVATLSLSMTSKTKGCSLNTKSE